jgi:cytochrome c-type biogenesis protein CcmH
MTGWLRRWGPWLVLVLVLGAGLAVGVHRGSDSHETLEQRTLSIAGAVRCPVCQGESAAGSNTDASIQIRDTIRADLVKGESRSQILAALQADYGTSILESPPASGITLWAWGIPVVIAAVAATGLALGFRHWRRQRPAGLPGFEPQTPGGPRTPGGPEAAGPPSAGSRVPTEDEALVREALAQHPDRSGGRR